VEGGREVLKNCGEDRVGGGKLCFPKIIFLVFDNIAIYFHNNIGGIQSHPFRNTNATAAPLHPVLDVTF
jgi:hypothetical protein